MYHNDLMPYWVKGFAHPTEANILREIYHSRISLFYQHVTADIDKMRVYHNSNNPRSSFIVNLSDFNHVGASIEDINSCNNDILPLPKKLSGFNIKGGLSNLLGYLGVINPYTIAKHSFDDSVIPLAKLIEMNKFLSSNTLTRFIFPTTVLVVNYVHPNPRISDEVLQHSFNKDSEYFDEFPLSVSVDNIMLRLMFILSSDLDVILDDVIMNTQFPSSKLAKLYTKFLEYIGYL